MKILFVLLLTTAYATSTETEPLTATDPEKITSTVSKAPTSTVSKAPTSTVSEAPTPSVSTSIVPSPSAKPGSSTSVVHSSSAEPQSSTSVAHTSSTNPESSTSAILTSSAGPESSTSAVPTSTTAPETSTSVLPSTSSVSPSVSPSPSTSVVPSTSMIPTTNPTTKPTTTPKPKPKYNVDTKVVDEKTKKPCLWFKADINVTYHYNETMSGMIALKGKDLQTDGACSNFVSSNQSNIILKWPGYSMTTVFMVGKSGWYFSEIGVTIDLKTSSNEQLIAGKLLNEDENTDFLHAQMNHSYSCALPKTIKLETMKKNGTYSSYNITVDLIDMMVQPFSNNNTLVSNKNVDSCSSKSKPSKSSSIVPIAVGCALAGLIVIVLIAYLIGRRKNDGTGYQQV